MSDLTLDYGTTRYLDVVVSDENGTPVSIAGSSFWWTVKADYLGTAAVLAKTEAAGIAIVDAPNGIAQVTIAAADWATIPNEPGRYVWDLTEKDAAQRVWRLDRGFFLVVPAVQETTSGD